MRTFLSQLLALAVFLFVSSFSFWLGTFAYFAVFIWDPLAKPLASSSKHDDRFWRSHKAAQSVMTV